ncbi:MAG: hypothetical protein K0U93_28590 [Gammaproteobacteria bacterium]|nr:hypothetical protein [Gammaproteobacteria bacterium]
MTLNVSALAVAMLVAAGLFSWGTFRGLRRGRSSAVVVRGISALGAMLAGVFFVGLAFNLATYKALTAEEAIATVEIAAASDGDVFSVLIREPSGQSRQFDLRGDEWQLDARVIKWHAYMAVLGIRNQYRLERVSSRYSDSDRARSNYPDVVKLSDTVGVDIWRLARRFGSLPALDTIFGSATYMPMASGASYTVAMTSSGLLARANNEAARKAVEGWR